MRHNKGFTLIESLTVVTIMAVLMAIAVPNFTLMQANNRVVGTGNELAAMLKQGRSEALVQRRNLQFNAINTSATSNVWGSKGWKVTNPATTTTLLEQHDVSPTVTISSTPAVSGIVFLAATGMITNTDATALATGIVFTVCDSATSNEKGVDVTMSRFGRVAVVRHTSTTKCVP
ncbi:MAG: GspH/FimT family pseudopilin [Agitococcus sp.]|nr:GspH/FimT family pseudopilin [Agitococcus sp.]MDO9177305.1 GspH/FimT family pseudopilin [Agitococcus sp.]